MRPASIQRYDYRGRRTQIGCGCATTALFSLVMLCAGIYAFSGVFLPIVFQLMGINRISDTDSIFEETIPVATLAPIQNSSVPSRVIVDLGEYGDEELNTTTRSYTIVTGNTDDGRDVATAQFTEQGLVDLCNQRDNFCANGDGDFRNIGIDLRTGGAILQADLNTNSPLGWQRVGIVLRLDNTNTRFAVVGVDYGGSVYDPNSLPFDVSDVIDEIDRIGNDLLRQLAVNTGGENYRLSQIIIDDDLLTIVMN